jgi:hypothetical protein
MQAAEGGIEAAWTDINDRSGSGARRHAWRYDRCCAMIA